MQPLQSSASTPSAIKQAFNTPHNAPKPIKELQSIKSSLQKVADKPSSDTADHNALIGNGEMNRLLLSLISQFIGQMQSTDTQSPASDAKPNASATGKIDDAHQIPSDEVSLTTDKSAGNGKTGEISQPLIESSALDKGTTVSGTESSSEQISALDDKPMATEGTPPSGSDILSASENGGAPHATNLKGPDTKSEETPHPEGLRSLEKFKVSLLGFSGQNKDEFQGFFINKMFLEGKFEIAHDLEQATSVT